MKTSDEKLVQQIKSVFEDYNDGLGEQGWAELLKKYPEKENKKLPIWWLTGIAATLIVVASLYFNGAFDAEKVILSAGTSKKETSIKPQGKNNKHDIGTSSSKINVGRNNVATNQPIQKINDLDNNIILFQKPTSFNNKSVVGHVEKKADVLAATTPNNENKSSTVVNNSAVIAAVQTDNSSAGKNTTDNNELVTEKDTKLTAGTKPTKLTTEEFLAEQSKMLTANENKKDKKNSTSKTTIDVFTGTFLNYHDDNEAKLSAGLGLNANVKVAKNIILSLGAGISQNKVSYENKVPTQVAEAMFASKDNALNAAPVSGLSYSATATNDMSFNGRMLSIDLPMVVKLYPTNKQDFYISTGINSSTYLSQKYTYNYSLSNFAIQNGMAQPQQQTEKSNFGGFDFANSAIFAIGINQNIGKNILVFEPYYRPALNTMGDKNLRISSAGINLKFNFNGAKK